EDEQQHARGPHEEPAVQLVVRTRGAATDGAPVHRVLWAARAGQLDGGHQLPPKTLPRWRGRNAAIVTTARPTTAQSMRRCRRGPSDQKSMSMSRMPLNAWNTTAPTSPASARPMTGFL